MAVSSPEEVIPKSSIEFSGSQNYGRVLVRKSVLVHSPCSRNWGRLTTFGLKGEREAAQTSLCRMKLS